MNKKIKKNKRFVILFSELEYEFFSNQAKKNGIPLSQMIRNNLLKCNREYYDFLKKYADEEEILLSENNANDFFKRKNHISKITFTPEEFDKITIQSLRLGISETEYIRRCCKEFFNKSKLENLYLQIDSAKNNSEELKELLTKIIENQNEILKSL